MTSSRNRLVVVALAAVIALPACGLVRRWRTPGTPAPIDLNTASLRKVEKLPGVTPSMAKRIVEGRPYDDPQALVARGVLTEHELDRIRDRIVVEGHER
jgi:hypothetical protein